MGLGTIEGKAQNNLQENGQRVKDLVKEYNSVVDNFLIYSNKILLNPKDRESALKAKELFESIQMIKAFAPNDLDFYDDIEKSKDSYLINYYRNQMDALKGILELRLNERQFDIDIMMAKIRKKGKEISNDD